MAERDRGVQVLPNFPKVMLFDLQVLESNSFPLSTHRAVVKNAMQYITDRTPCITFLPANSSSPNYVVFIPGTECASELGMKGGEQIVYLNAGCFRNGLIVPVHEILHLLGFVHEHNRTHWC